MRKELIDVFFTEAYEVRDDYRGSAIYNLKPRDNAYGDIIKKIQKMGHKKIISLKLDVEEVLGYTNLFIYEALLKYDGELGAEGDVSDISELPKAGERNEGTNAVSELKDYVSLYCYDKYNKLSRDNGVNYDYYYNKCSGKYERIVTCEYCEQCEEKEAAVSSNNNIAKAFIDMYINEEYLTPKQIEYCKAVLEFGPSKGAGIYDMFGNLLYTKQQANYYNNEIRARLAQFLVQDRQ